MSSTGLARASRGGTHGGTSAPPFALVPGDRFNISLGMLLGLLLALVKDSTKLPKLVKWQLCTYTVWNWVFCIARFALKQRQWDPFLAVNSLGVCWGFRTGLTQALHHVRELWMT